MKAETPRTSLLRRIKIPHVFPLLAGVILFCSLLTYVVPSGEYTREERTYGTLTRTVVVPGTYERLPKAITPGGVVLASGGEEGAARPTSILGFFTAIPRGMEGAADIIFFIFIVGGVFGILTRTGTIAAMLHSLIERYKDSAPLLTIIVMIAIAIGGSTLGMGEELIPLVPIFLIVSKELGYDRIYGLALVAVAAEVGFAAATTNPFTVQIAQGIAEVPLGSGIGFRLVFFVCASVVAISYVLRYGKKLRQDPSNSIMADDPFHLPDYDADAARITMQASHKWIIVATIVLFALILYAVQSLGWWLAEMAGGFLLIGVVAAVLGGLSLGEATHAFVKGMEEMVVAALVVGFAKGIQVVLEDAQVMDTLIFAAASVLQQVPAFVAAEGMLLFQAFLNFFIPSGSGQAAVTMPLMAPLADVLGISRQTAVFAFTCGDGFSNSIIPTSGILMAMLGLAKIPYEKWLRFILPLFLQLMLLAAVFLAIAVFIGY